MFLSSYTCGFDSSTLATSAENKLVKTPHIDTNVVSTLQLTDADLDFLESCGKEKHSTYELPSSNSSKLVSVFPPNGQKSLKKQKTFFRNAQPERGAIYENTRGRLPLQKPPRQPNQSPRTAEELEEQLKQINLETKQFWDRLMDSNPAKVLSPTREEVERPDYDASRMAWNGFALQNGGKEALCAKPYTYPQPSKEKETLFTAPAPTTNKRPDHRLLGEYGWTLETTNNNHCTTGSKRGYTNGSNQARHAKASFMPPSNLSRMHYEVERNKEGSRFDEW